ncbi:MAG: tetratricopeptide repeat protein [Myxococcales bacterium]|nr:tetratricopeptide repeat protein [Myxococcales bacterium]
MTLNLSPGLVTNAAAIAAGAALAAVGARVAEISGVAPLPELLAICLVIAILLLIPRRGSAALSAVGVLPLLTLESALGRVPAGPLLETATLLAPWVAGAAGAAALAPLRPALRRARAPQGGLALLCYAALGGFSASAAALLAILSGAVALGIDPSLRSLGARTLKIRPAGAVLAALLLLPSLTTWFLLRPALGPTPAALAWFVTGVGAAVSLPRSWSLAVVFHALAGGAAWLVLDGPAPAPGPVLFALFGAAGGAGLRLSRAGDTVLVAPLLAALLLLPAVRALPGTWQAAGARSLAALPSDAFLRERVSALRGDTEVVTFWGAWGASQVWGGERVTLVELDGSTAGSSGRARAVERLAGTLAGCAAAGRGRVRVVGDDFGRALVSLREQNFEGMDVALPDAELVARLAAADVGAHRAWLSSETRLLTVPGAALLRSHGMVDAVVEIVRVGWQDGRTRWPTPARLAQTATHVSPDGAHVLVLPGLGVDSGVLEGAVRAFAGVWPTVQVWVPPEGVEALLLVGGRAPVPWPQVDECVRLSAGTREFGVTTALELASLLVADQHLAAGLDSTASPGRGLPQAHDPLPVAGLLAASSEAEHAFAGAPAGLAALQATRRASLSVLRSSAMGDVRAALEAARGMQDQPGAGAAIDPMVAPILDRARGSWRLARSEGDQSREWAAADGAIDAALLLNPASATARCLRADIALSRRQFEVALRWYGECAERDPGSWLAYQGLAAARQQTSDFAGAESAFRESARLAPEVWQTSLNLGVFLRARGNFTEAERWLRHAADSSASATTPGRSRPHRALAMVYLESGRGELALVEARRAEVDEPTGDSAWLLGAAAYELGRWREAEASFRLALERNPKLVEAQTGLGLCLAQRNDYQGAASSFREALALDPNHQVAREKLELLRPLLIPSTPSSPPSPP